LRLSTVKEVVDESEPKGFGRCEIVDGLWEGDIVLRLSTVEEVVDESEPKEFGRYEIVNGS
jgi:hypothetical protein